MTDYLKLFETHSQYEAYMGGGEIVLPNVSHCINENEVHYNPIPDPRLIVIYSVEDDSNPTKMYDYYAEEGDEEWWVTAEVLFDKVEIDDVEVSISDLDTAYGMYQLSSGTHIVKYTLKDTTTNMFMFYGCGAITSVDIPNSVTTIGDSAFIGCSGLTSVKIPNSVTSIGNESFSECTGLTSVDIPNSVTTIGESAFFECTGLTSVNIPNSVTTIGPLAFANCSSLSNVTIAEGITETGSNMFERCTSLTHIVLPSTITQLIYRTFLDCTSLISVTCLATTPPTLDAEVFDNNASSRKIYVPAASVATYQAASGWSKYASDIQAIPTV